MRVFGAVMLAGAPPPQQPTPSYAREYLSVTAILWVLLVTVAVFQFRVSSSILITVEITVTVITLSSCR